jgi:acyl-CoA synthetase (AMP-forming)/AMP-acid ligase II
VSADSRPSSLVYYLERWAMCTPQNEAAVDGGCRLSYAELAQHVDGCARAFMAAGLSTGDRLAMLTTPRLEFLIVFLALQKIGAVWVGLNPRHRLSELDYVVKDTRPKLLVGIERFEGRDFLSDLQKLSERVETSSPPVVIRGEEPVLDFYGVLYTRDVSDDELRRASEAITPASPSCVVYTSGSTGEPKGALLCHHGQMCAYLRWHAYLGIERMRLICDLPVDHIGGLDRVFLSVISGGTVIFQRRFEPAALLQCIERERITVWSGELTQWIKCAPLLGRYDLSSLLAAGYGGGPPTRELLDSYAKISPRIFSGYGMTETSDAIMFTDHDVSLEVLCEHNVGRPQEGVLVRLVSADGEPVDRGEAGLLEVRSSSVFLGYLGREDATAQTFSSDGWLRTGDLLRERANGTFDFLGRRDNTYKSGGYNIYPREIEVVLESHPAVGSAAVVGVPDEVFQMVGHAFVEPAASGVSPTPRELRTRCAEYLANYKVPKKITVLNALPTLRNDKVDRVSLSQRALEMAGGDLDINGR